VQVLIKSDTSLWRVYKTERARNIALARLRKYNWKYNYFLCYKDVQGFALQAANVDWLTDGAVYVSR
jgi:hypothetical protein